MRRCTNALYFSDEVLEKLINEKDLDLSEVVSIFYPAETNPSQYGCTRLFFQEMFKQGILRNDQLKMMFPDKKDYLMFLSHILPKLQKFRAIQSTGGKNAKKYELRFDRDFSNILKVCLISWLLQIGCFMA
jgi:hypothetical protein